MTSKVVADVDAAAADAVVAVGTVAASALAFVEGAAASAAFLRAAVVDLVVAELADVEVVAGMNFPSLCPWHLILWPLERRPKPFSNPRCRWHLEPAF